MKYTLRLCYSFVWLHIIVGILLLSYAGEVSILAQETIVEGQVIDKDNGQILPFANVFFTGTTIGTTTDFEGKFKLRTRETVSTLTISFTGYKEQIIPLQTQAYQYLDITLESTNRELETFEVKQKRRLPKDTLAMRLYRRIIKAKIRNRPKNYDSYQYEQYEKTQVDIFNFKEGFKKFPLFKPFDFIFENTDTTKDGRPFLAVMLKEKISGVFYQQQPERKKEIIKAKRLSGIENLSIDEIADLVLIDVNVYDNVIDLAGKGFVSPFADGASASYRYFLTDSAVLDKEWCYKLEFVAIRKQDLAFTGHAWIHDETAAVKSIDMKILDKINLNFVSDLSVSQDYTFYEKEYWIKNKDKLKVHFSLLQNNEKMSFRLQHSVSRKDIEINKTIPEKTFKGEQEVTLSQAAIQDDTYWQNLRHEQLNATEQGVYDMIDTLKTTKAYKRYDWISRLFTNASFKTGSFSWGRFYQFFSWNEIEGYRFRLGGRTNPDFSKRFQLLSYAAYGTKDKEWKYYLGFRYHLKRKNNRWHLLGGDYAYDLRSVSFAETLFYHDNIVSSILTGGDVSGLLFERRAFLFYDREWIKGFNTQWTLLNRNVYAQPGFYDFKTSIPDNVIQNVAKISTTELGLSFTWAYKQEYFEYAFSRFPLIFRHPSIRFKYSLGRNKILEANNLYHKLSVSVRQEFPTRLGFTMYNIGAEKIWGDVPYPFLEIHKGNNTFIYNGLTFALMNPFEFVSDEYTYLWLSHQFDGLILNTIPLIKKLKWRSLVRFKGLAGRISQSNQDLVLLPENLSSLSGIYAEAGVGLENIFKVLGVEFVWRLTQRDKVDVSKFGIQGRVYVYF